MQSSFWSVLWAYRTRVALWSCTERFTAAVVAWRPACPASCHKRLHHPTDRAVVACAAAAAPLLHVWAAQFHSGFDARLYTGQLQGAQMWYFMSHRSSLLVQVSKSKRHLSRLDYTPERTRPQTVGLLIQYYPLGTRSGRKKLAVHGRLHRAYAYTLWWGHLRHTCVHFDSIIPAEMWCVI